MAEDNEEYTVALNKLLEKRDKLANELAKLDQGIAFFTDLLGMAGTKIVNSMPNQYRGVKSYEAAKMYMDEKGLDEIDTGELADALVARGLYLGKRAERNVSNLGISIKQNNNQGRKELVSKDGKVYRKLRKGNTA